MRSRWIRRASVAVVCPMILLAGCADRQRPAVEQTATAFLAAVGAGDTRAGCALLAPATRDLLEYRDALTCVAALTHLPLPPGSVLDATERGGTAQVHTTTDTPFLTRTSQDWRIAAAGCQFRDDAWDEWSRIVGTLAVERQSSVSPGRSGRRRTAAGARACRGARRSSISPRRGP